MNPTRATAPRVLPGTRAARRSFGLRSVALLFALTACGGDDANDSTAGEASPAGVAGQTSAPAAARASAAAGAPIELTVSQGPFAGTHQVADNVCTVQPGTWMVTSGNQANQRITQFLLMLEDVPVTGGSSSRVGVMANFGETGTLNFGSEVGEGSGTGTVRRDGQGAVIEVDGTTGEGEKVSVVIRCQTVGGA